MATIKVIDNKVPYSEIRRIPKTRDGRLLYIERKLNYLRGKNRHCPALNADVYFDPDPEQGSIHETAFWASKSHKSVVCTMNITEIIRNATLVRTDNPKPSPSTQIDRLGFTKVYILYTKVRYYGTAKLTIGERNRGNFVHYCVTSIKII